MLTICRCCFLVLGSFPYSALPDFREAPFLATATSILLIDSKPNSSVSNPTCRQKVFVLAWLVEFLWVSPGCFLDSWRSLCSSPFCRQTPVSAMERGYRFSVIDGTFLHYAEGLKAQGVAPSRSSVGPSPASITGALLEWDGASAFTAAGPRHLGAPGTPGHPLAEVFPRAVGG